MWITGTGSCARAWVEDNNLEGNAVAAVRFDSEPSDGCWGNNHGLDNWR